MWPMKTSSIFRNRWFALLWAAGILWFAYDVAESAHESKEAEKTAAVSGEVPPDLDELNNQTAEILRMMDTESQH